MKTILSALILSVSVFAQAAPTFTYGVSGGFYGSGYGRYNGNANPIDRYPDRDLPGHQPIGGGGGYTIATCAPGVLEGNVAVTEQTLRQLANSSDFTAATEFKARIAAISSLKSNDLKVAKYFSLIGVDIRDSSAVAEFIGARDVRGSWLTSLEKSTGLSGHQADAVARSLQTSLRGQLQ